MPARPRTRPRTARSRRLVPALLALALVLAACGDDSSTGADQASDTTASDSVATATDAEDRSAEVERLRTLARSIELTAAPVTVEGDVRTVAGVAVPVDPQRIVTLEPSLTDAAAALGFGQQIVATVEQPGGGIHDHVADLVADDVALLGSEGEPNLEAVALARPDLIVTWDYYDNSALAEIAPVVALPYADYEKRIGETLTDEQYVTWVVRWVALTLGADEEVEAVMADFQQAVADARAAIDDIVGDASVGLIDVRADSILLSGYGSDGVSALLYGDLGLRPDPLSDFYVWEELSLERVPELTSDYLLTFAADENAQERLDKLLTTPIWQGVPAVAAERVAVVEPNLYYRGDDGPLGTALLLDDLVDRLDQLP